MNRINLSDDVSLSQIIYGMWRLTEDSDTSPSYVNQKIEACLDQQITTIDQADIYGGYEAEEVFGTALRQSGHRDKLEIVTKCDIIAPIGRHKEARVKYYDTSREHITQSVEQSLKLMNIDYIDLLLIHRPDPLMDAEQTGAVLDSLVQSGKAKHIGVSNFKPYDFALLQSYMHQKLVTNQIEISVLANECFTNGDVAFMQKERLPIMAWSPLAGGRLFDKSNQELFALLNMMANSHNTSPTAIAVAWLLAHPANIMPVMGTNSIERIKSLSMGCKVKLDRQSWFEIYELANGHEVP
jgi:predicted oxidoreductase